MIETLIGSVLALDRTLAALAIEYGPAIVLLLAMVVFAETGLVVFPFLPGDSLLFVAGAVIGTAGVDVNALVLTLTAAAIAGDSTNYWIGRFVGPRVFNLPRGHWFSRIARPAYLERTQAFYRRYGRFTILIGRFVPIVRTFAPFLAGIAQMPYRRFLPFSVAGSMLWVGSLVYSGYLFGNIPWVRGNLTLIVVAIVAVSVMPIAIGLLRERWAASSGRPRV